MRPLVTNDHIIKYFPSTHESALILRDRCGHRSSQSVRKALRDNLVNHVAQAKRLEVLHPLRIFDLGDQGNDGLVAGIKIATIVEEAQTLFSNHVFDHMSKILEEKPRVTISPRSFKRTNFKYRDTNLLFGQLFLISTVIEGLKNS